MPLTNEGIVAPQEFKTFFDNTLASIPGRDLIKPNDPNLKQLITYIETKSESLKKYAEPSVLSNAIKSEFKSLMNNKDRFKVAQRT